MVKDTKAFNCPSCGFNVFKKYNKSKDLLDLLRKRSKKTKKLLRQISKLISENVKTENRTTYFYFLYGLKNVEDNVLNWGIEQYYNSRHYLQGKGFAYLRTIIQNRNKNIGALKKNERAMLGSTPPVIEHED